MILVCWSVIFDILEETHIITPSPMYNLNLKDSSNNTGFKHMEFSANEFHDISGHFFDGTSIDFSYGGYLDSIPVEYNGLSITMWVLKIGPKGDDLLYLDSSFNNITMEDGDIDGVKIGIYNSKLTISYYGQILKDTTLSIDTDVWFHIGLTVDSSGNGIFYFKLIFAGILPKNKRIFKDFFTNEKYVNHFIPLYLQKF